jgi:hypothetical protein
MLEREDGVVRTGLVWLRIGAVMNQQFSVEIDNEYTCGFGMKYSLYSTITNMALI